jgi:hypothetical protein
MAASSPAIEAARHLVALILEGPPPDDAALAEALDRVAAAYHDVPDSSPGECDAEPPRRDSTALCAFLGERFPDYGCYTSADPLGRLESPSMGDAIDDLLDLVHDLVHDLGGAVWLADHVGLDDAHWHLRLHHFHWGPPPAGAGGLPTFAAVL